MKKLLLSFVAMLFAVVTFLGFTPPSSSYLDVDTKKCILFVPKGSIDNYKKHEEWGNFQNIQEHELTKFTIITSVNETEMGSVTEGGEYAYGTEVILTATANTGYRFTQWTDGNVDNPRIVTVTENKEYIAEFEIEDFALYATSASPELGYVKHTIEAVAIEGFEFDRWSDDNTENPRTVVLTEDTKLYAYFRMSSGGTPVDIESAKIKSAEVYGAEGVLYVDGAEADYHVMDAAGRLIYSGRRSALQLPSGVYIVTIGGEVQKIAL